MADRDNNGGDRNIRKVLGRNQIPPHVHHPRDVPGTVSLVDVPRMVIPFDTGVVSAAGPATTSASIFSVPVPGMTQTFTLPPLTTPANKYRVKLKFEAVADTLISGDSIGKVFFAQDGVGFGPEIVWGIAAAGNPYLRYPLEMFYTIEVAPGTYTWTLRFVETTGNVGDIISLSNMRFEVTIDTLVVS